MASTSAVSHGDGMAVRARVKAECFGFLTDAELAIVAADGRTRLMPILVRCGACRFTAPAQDAAKLIAMVEKNGDYVRDVSLPVQGDRV